jgi:hypothetical protein
MAWLFSYVVDHDRGVAPHPSGRYCTLCRCKFGWGGRRNIVELARPGDWVVGTGGRSRQSAGHGRIIYAMLVREKMDLVEYVRDHRFRDRLDATCGDAPIGREALIATEFYYFGREAISVSGLPASLRQQPLEKRGPGFRRDFDEEFIQRFAGWIRRRHHRGLHGKPCDPWEPPLEHPATSPARPRRVRRRSSGSSCRR